MTMQKTDAELIAEVEGLERKIDTHPQLFKMTASPITNDLLNCVSELARRLKAANAERDEFREKYYETLDARTAAREAEYLNLGRKVD